jgi:poly(hydroxyalkanoate) depolymerase family esterase
MTRLSIAASMLCLAIASGCPDGYAGSTVPGGDTDAAPTSDTSDQTADSAETGLSDSGRIDTAHPDDASTPDGSHTVIRHDWEMSVGSVSREVRVVRPDDLPDRPTVWVFLHSCLQTGSEFANSIGAESLVRQRGVIALFPTQDRIVNPQGCWRWYSQSQRQPQDSEPAFVAGLVDAAATRLDVNPGASYLAGLSAGGGLASLTAGCQPDTFDGVMIHSGLEFAAADAAFEAPGVMTSPTQARDPADAGRLAYECGSAGDSDIPILIVHGRDDRTVDPGHAERTARQFLHTRDLRDDGQNNDSKSWTSSDTTNTTMSGRQVTVRTFEDTPLKMLLISDTGHAYAGASGDYGDPDAPDATAEAWQFFLSGR